MAPAAEPPAEGRAASFTELAALFAARQRSENTRRAYGADLDRFVQWCQAEGTQPLALGPDEVARYQSACEAEGTSPATVARRLAALSSFYALAVEEGSIGRSPLADLVRPVAVPSVTLELDAVQASALVDAGARLNPKTALLVDLLLLDGLKLGEALSADASDVTDTHGGDGATLSVARRGGRRAEIELHEPTVEAAHSYLQGRREGPLFLNDRAAATTRTAGGGDADEAGRLTRFGADYLLKRASDEAGFAQPVSANVLRRSYVAMAHAAGDSVETIRHNLGHRDPRTTRRHLAR
ncbi:MAG: site-specific integrase [Acidimicrobiales bacterium]